MKVFLLAVTLLMNTYAFATTDAKVKKAESAMMAACTKEYPKAVKGKKFGEVAEWVEHEERGANKEKFKQSKCYNLHEDWEKVAEHKEEGEENEHNE